MAHSVCRWGFLGAATIARKNWKAIHLSGNGRVAAVASRSLDRAEAFVTECSAEVPQSAPVVAVQGYQSLLDRDDVDAIYIPLPTGIRKEWVVAAAKAGKHVLCEKPAAINTDDLQSMVDACTDANVQFMDGVMFDHSRRIEEVKRAVSREGNIGRIRRVHAHFSFSSDDSFEQSNIRADHNLEPHGCLGDLGWYCIRFILWATNFAKPHSVSARMLTSLGGDSPATKVPGEMSAELQFSEGVSAGFYCSFLTSNQQTAIVSGDQGYVTLDDFVLPLYDANVHYSVHDHQLEIDNCRWNFNRRSQSIAIPEYASGESNAQEVNMVRRFAEIVQSDSLDSFYPELSLKTQMILDACCQSAAENGIAVEL